MYTCPFKTVSFTIIAGDEDVQEDVSRSDCELHMELCEKCCFMCHTAGALQRHLQCHSADQDTSLPFICPICPFATRQFLALRMHMRGHPGNHSLRMYECSHCVLLTGQVTHIEGHLNRDHPDERFHYIVTQVYEVGMKLTQSNVKLTRSTGVSV